MNVLLVKTSSLGDVIHTLPALTDAMNNIPNIRFDWVVEQGFAEIPQWHPAVDKVIPIALRKWRKQPLQAISSGEWRDYRNNLQARHYDAIIDAQSLLKSAIFSARLAHGKRFGMDRASCKEGLAACFYDIRITVPKGQHAIERNRQLIASALNYPLPSEQGNFGIVERFTKSADKDYLVFIHGTTRADKHWPDVYWQELIKQATDDGWPIKLLWHNAAEKARSEGLAKLSDQVEVLPKMNLQGVATVLAQAKACVSVDTGLSHLAAALERPNITLFGPTDPGLVGGYGKHQLCLQASDYPEAEQRVEPDIFAALTPHIVYSQLKKLLHA